PRRPRRPLPSRGGPGPSSCCSSRGPRCTSARPPGRPPAPLGACCASAGPRPPSTGREGAGQPDLPVPKPEDMGLQINEGGSWLRRSPGKALMSMTACCPVWLLMMMSIPKSDTPSA
ncbi:unnamed protein product, partial [Gulo gulo]